MTAQLSLDATVNLQAHINDVLFGRAGPWALTDQQRGVLHMLRYRLGAAHARPLAELAGELKLKPRDVKAAVQELVKNFGLPIGASRAAPFGYYLCVTPEDIEAAVRPLVHEIESLAARVRALVGSERVAEIFGQFQLKEQ